MRDWTAGPGLELRVRALIGKRMVRWAGGDLTDLFCAALSSSPLFLSFSLFSTSPTREGTGRLTVLAGAVDPSLSEENCVADWFTWLCGRGPGDSSLVERRRTRGQRREERREGEEGENSKMI